MNQLIRRLLRTLALLAALPVVGAVAGDFSIDCYCTNSGMMFSTGGDFELSGTAGQHDAGPPLVGDELELAGGFWPCVEGFCLGDLDDDHEVGLSDLATLLANYGITSGGCYLDGDLDFDGDVDLSDLAELLSLYGTACP